MYWFITLSWIINDLDTFVLGGYSEKLIQILDQNQGHDNAQLAIDLEGIARNHFGIPQDKKLELAPICDCGFTCEDCSCIAWGMWHLILD